MKTVAKIQYISNGNSTAEHIEAIHKACIAGAKWIQLRLKNKNTTVYLMAAKRAKEICDAYQAILIINDNPVVAKESGAAGVHLGQDDMSILEARKIVGKDAIIGATANTWAQVEKLVKEPIDYIGFGPYRMTTTKKKLSPIVGLIGYQHLLFEMEKQGLNMPIIAIGGIELVDISTLMMSGVHGIAIASLMNNAANKTLMYQAIEERIS